MLVPPVNVNDGALPDAHEVLRQAAKATRPLDLRLGPAARDDILFCPSNTRPLLTPQASPLCSISKT